MIFAVDVEISVNFSNEMWYVMYIRMWVEKYKYMLTDGSSNTQRKVDNGFARIRNAGFLIPKFDRSSVFGALRNPGLRSPRI